MLDSFFNKVLISTESINKQLTWGKWRSLISCIPHPALEIKYCRTKMPSFPKCISVLRLTWSHCRWCMLSQEYIFAFGGDAILIHWSRMGSLDAIRLLQLHGNDNLCPLSQYRNSPQKKTLDKKKNPHLALPPLHFGSLSLADPS